MKEMVRRSIYLLLVLTVVTSCMVKRQARISFEDIDHDSLFNTAHIGVKVIDLDSDKILYSLNSNKYYMPASNTKLLTMFAGLQIFGDSIPGWSIASDLERLYIIPNGDPTFLLPEFGEQKLFDILKSTNKTIQLILPKEDRISRFGSGWSWGTWQQTYSPERSTMPIYGNMVRFYSGIENQIKAVPSYFDNCIDQSKNEFANNKTTVLRSENANQFEVHKNSVNRWVRPFTFQNNDSLSFVLLKDTLLNIRPGIKLELSRTVPRNIKFTYLHSVPTDTLMGIMMKRSDNFFAEQILLMASKVKYGSFQETDIKNYVKNDLLNSVWRNGSWADGSGLSRNNLISPDEFVGLLRLIYESKDFERVVAILPKGGEGTLKGLYSGVENNIAAKTGTLNNHLGLSGFLKTESGKNVAFSFLVNNHRGNAHDYRRSIESFLIKIIENY